MRSFGSSRSLGLSTAVPIRWRDILDATVKMLLVIGLLERQHPLTYRAQRFKAFAGPCRTVFDVAEQGD